MATVQAANYVFLPDSGKVDGTVTKASGSLVRLPCDFGNVLQLINGAAIVSQSVTTSGTGAPTIAGVRLDSAYQISCTVSGGTTGSYNLTYSITLNDSDSTVISCTAPITII